MHTYHTVVNNRLKYFKIRHETIRTYSLYWLQDLAFQPLTPKRQHRSKNPVRLIASHCWPWWPHVGPEASFVVCAWLMFVEGDLTSSIVGSSIWWRGSSLNACYVILLTAHASVSAIHFTSLSLVGNFGHNSRRQGHWEHSHAWVGSDTWWRDKNSQSPLLFNNIFTDTESSACKTDALSALLLRRVLCCWEGEGMSPPWELNSD